MSRFTTLALALSALLVSVAAANAATAKKPMHHTPHHAMHASKSMHGRTASKAAPSADNSADALNAQSLARSQAPAQ